MRESVVVLADGSPQRVTFTEEPQRGRVPTMAEMRRLLATDEPPGPRWVAATCGRERSARGKRCQR